jgi:hypothetical protein
MTIIQANYVLLLANKLEPLHTYTNSLKWCSWTSNTVDIGYMANNP